MKFESEFGIGEIITRDVMKGDMLHSSEMYEVTGIQFGSNGEQLIICLHTQTQRVIVFKPHDIEGDPDFDQVKGRYPEIVLQD